MEKLEVERQRHFPGSLPNSRIRGILQGSIFVLVLVKAATKVYSNTTLA